VGVLVTVSHLLFDHGTPRAPRLSLAVGVIFWGVRGRLVCAK
jgi:hypothetical protein